MAGKKPTQLIPKDIQKEIADIWDAPAPEVVAPTTILGEMGKSFNQGLYGVAPAMLGQATKALSPVGSKIYKVGQELQNSGEAISLLPELQRTGYDERGQIAKTLISGAGAVGQMLPTVAASVVNPVLGATTAATLYGGSTYQDTKERMLKQDGLDDAFAAANPNDPRVMAAKATSLGTGVVQGLGEGAMAYVGGKFLEGTPLLGKFGKKLYGESAVRRFGVDTALRAAGEGITEPIQDEAQAALERSAGLKDAPAFMSQAAESARGGLGASLLMAPLGIPGHYKAAKQAELNNSAVPPAVSPAVEDSPVSGLPLTDQRQGPVTLGDQIGRNDDGTIKVTGALSSALATVGETPASEVATTLEDQAAQAQAVQDHTDATPEIQNKISTQDAALASAQAKATQTIADSTARIKELESTRTELGQGDSKKAAIAAEKAKIVSAQEDVTVAQHKRDLAERDLTDHLAQGPAPYAGMYSGQMPVAPFEQPGQISAGRNVSDILGALPGGKLNEVPTVQQKVSGTKSEVPTVRDDSQVKTDSHGKDVLDREGESVTLYHGSNSDDHESIMQKGILPNKKYGIGLAEQEQARLLADSSTSRAMAKDRVVYKIEIPKAEITRLEKDHASGDSADWRMYNADVKSGSIRPEWIKAFKIGNSGEWQEIAPAAVQDNQEGAPSAAAPSIDDFEKMLDEATAGYAAPAPSAAAPSNIHTDTWNNILASMTAPENNVSQVVKGVAGPVTDSMFTKTFSQQFPSLFRGGNNPQAKYDKAAIKAAVKALSKGKAVESMSPFQREIAQHIIDDVTSLQEVEADQLAREIAQLSEEENDALEGAISDDYDIEDDPFATPEELKAHREAKANATITGNETETGKTVASVPEESIAAGEPVQKVGSDTEAVGGEVQAEKTDDAGGLKQQVAFKGDTKPTVIGSVQKQGGKAVGTSDFMDGFTADPNQDLFGEKKPNDNESVLQSEQKSTKGEAGGGNAETVTIKYNATTRAITNKATGDIYALIREIKKRNGSTEYEVKGYSKLEGTFPEFEKTYSSKESAEEAAQKIADATIKPQEPAKPTSKTDSPIVQRLLEIQSQLKGQLTGETAGAMDRSLSKEIYDELKRYDSTLAYNLMKKGEEGIQAALIWNGAPKSNKAIIYQAQVKALQETIDRAIATLRKEYSTAGEFAAPTAIPTIDDFEAMFDAAVEPAATESAAVTEARSEYATSLARINEIDQYFKDNGLENSDLRYGSDGYSVDKASKVFDNLRLWAEGVLDRVISPQHATRGQIANERDSFDRAMEAVEKAYAKEQATGKPSLATAAAHAGNAFDAGVAAMKALMKNSMNPDKLNMLPTFDDKMYQQMKPHLTSMWFEAKAAASDVTAALKEFISKVLAAFGADTIVYKPFIMKFAQEVLNGDIIEEKKLEATDDHGAISDLEQNSSNGDTTDSVGKGPVSNGSRPDERGVGSGGGTTVSQGNAGGSNTGLSDSKTTVPGERSDQSVHSGPESRRLTDGTAGDLFGQRSDNDSVDGQGFDPASTKAVEKTASKPSSLKEKHAAQLAGQNVKVIPGDSSNIDKSVPFLLPGQREDVKFAEDRFAQPGGHGVLFTNGTGTGKTYTGLGIIKRLERQGKKNILIVTPKKMINEDWIKSGKNLHLDITDIENKKDSGKGIVITTYSTFGDNNELVNRKWDAIVFDESNEINSNSKGTHTKAHDAMHGLTLHPDGVLARARMTKPELWEESEGITKQLDELKGPNNGELYNNLVARQGVLVRQMGVVTEKVRAEVTAAQTDGSRPKVVFLSATPFAHEKSIQYANGFLFNWNDGQADDEGSRPYNSGSNYQRFMMRHLGYSMRTGKMNEPGVNVDRGVMQRQFNTWLKTQKVLSGRALDSDYDYDRKFVMVDSGIGRTIDEGLDWLRERRTDRMGAILSLVDRQFDYMSRRYLLEAIKAKEAIPLIKEHIAMGRKVVLFHDYNQGGGINPFDVSDWKGSTNRISYKDADGKVQSDELGVIVREFLAERPDLVKLPFNSYKSAVETIREAFPELMQVNGPTNGKIRSKNIQDFQTDNNDKNLILVQSDAGGAGISLHDTTGVHPRVLMNLGMPVKPTTAIQQEGRIYRVGQASNAMFRYMNTGTNWERTAFANNMAQRTSGAENLAAGDQARSLLDAYINAFQASDIYKPGFEGEGIGGKEMDRAANNALSEYDKAKTHYWATRKGRQNHIGADFFATPEPVGYKMAEWADVADGEAALEPSGGKAAIARYLNPLAKRVMIEPSVELSSTAKLVFDGDVIDGTFEDHHVGANKYDSIVMNPPFGSSGKTAMDHLEKAAKHLKPGGRIVALIPAGPSMDKRFDKWMNGEETEKIAPAGVVNGQEVYAGDTIDFVPMATPVSMSGTGTITRVLDPVAGVARVFFKNSKGTANVEDYNIHSIDPTGPRIKNIVNEMTLVADIKLPSVTFERAGTKVNTHIVILDKADAGSMFTINRDYSDAETTKDLFDRIENLDIPKRNRKVATTAPAPAPAAGRTALPNSSAVSAAETSEGGFALGQFNHTKTGKPIFVATLADRLEPAAFNAARNIASRNGGSYSYYAKDGAIPGFHFKSEEARSAFTAAYAAAGTVQYSAGVAQVGGHLNAESISKVQDMIFAALPAGSATLSVVDSIGNISEKGLAAHGAKGKDLVAGGMHQTLRTVTTGDMRSLITLALDHGQERDGYHEVEHAAEALGVIGKKDIETLARTFPDKAGKKSSERRADAYADYIAGKATPAIWARRVFDKMANFIKQIANGLKGQGFRTADDVFADLSSGKLKEGVTARQYLKSTASQLAISQLDLWEPIDQEITSAVTSINAVKSSAVFHKGEFAPGTRNADLGGGRFDNATEEMKNRGVENVIYDPFNRSEEHNADAAGKIRDGQSDTVTVANVLNVVQDEWDRARILRQAANAVKPGGTAFIWIYEGDGTGSGTISQFREGHPAAWQENRKAADYMAEVRQHFSDVTRKGLLITARGPLTDEQYSLQEGSTQYSAAAPAIAAVKDYFTNTSPADMAKGLGQILTPSTAAQTVKEVFPRVNAAMNYLFSTPVFHAERDARKRAPGEVGVKDFTDTGISRAENNMEIQLDFMGYDGPSAVKPTFLQRMKEGVTTWESSDTTTEWGRIEKLVRKGLDEKQQAAVDVMQREGDINNAVYATLAEANKNTRIAATEPTQAAFDAYRKVRDFIDGPMTEARERAIIKLGETTGVDKKAIAGTIKAYRAHLAKLKGWMPRKHGEGSHQVNIYHTIKALPFAGKAIEGGHRATLPFYAGKEVAKEIRAFARANMLLTHRTNLGGPVIIASDATKDKIAAKIDALEIKLRLTMIEENKEAMQEQLNGLKEKLAIASRPAAERIAEFMAASESFLGNIRAQYETEMQVLRSRKADAEAEGAHKGVIREIKAEMARLGDGAVKVKVYMRLNETQRQAENLKAEVSADIPKVLDHVYHQGEEYTASYKQIDPISEGQYGDMVGDFASENIIKKAIEKAQQIGKVGNEDAAGVKQAIFRATADMMLARGAGRHQIRRSEYLIQGYDQSNTTQIYHDYMTGAAGMISKAMYAKQQFDNYRYAPADVKPWAEKYIKDTLRNMGHADRIGGNVRAIATFMYLGGKISSILINGTQTWTLGVAELGRRTKQNSVKAIGKAQLDILKGRLSTTEQALFDNELWKEQEMATAIHEMSGSGEGATGKASRFMHTLVGKSLLPFQEMEMMNRRTMVLASYRSFMADGMSAADAIKEAMDVNRKTNFEMSRANLPGFAHNPVGRTVYALQSFVWNNWNWIYNRATSGEKADILALLKYAGMITVLGGASALAGGDEINKLIRRLTGKDYKLAMEVWTSKNGKQFGTAGELMNAAVWHGGMGALGVNISNAMRLNVPMSGFITGESTAGESAMGIWSGMADKIKNTAMYASRGQVGRALESAAPAAIEAPMKAYRMATQGATTTHGKPIFDEKGKPLKYSGLDAAKRAIGLQPSEQSFRSEVTQSQVKTKAFWSEERGTLLDSMRVAKSAEERKAVNIDIMKFNKNVRKSQAWPTVGIISGKTIQHSLTASKPDKKKQAAIRVILGN